MMAGRLGRDIDVPLVTIVCAVIFGFELHVLPYFLGVGEVCTGVSRVPLACWLFCRRVLFIPSRFVPTVWCSVTKPRRNVWFGIDVGDCRGGRTPIF